MLLYPSLPGKLFRTNLPSKGKFSSKWPIFIFNQKSLGMPAEEGKFASSIGH